jgi:hypothetical protein
MQQAPSSPIPWQSSKNAVKKIEEKVEKWGEVEQEQKKGAQRAVANALESLQVSSNIVMFMPSSLWPCLDYKDLAKPQMRAAARDPRETMALRRRQLLEKKKKRKGVSKYNALVKEAIDQAETDAKLDS